jgi:cyclase
MTGRSAIRTSVLLALLFAGIPAHARELAMRVFRINDHVWCFYDGRPPQAHVDPADHNWADFGANNVGVATYVMRWSMIPSPACARRNGCAII